MNEGRPRQPGQQRTVFHRVPAPVTALAEFLVSPVRPEEQTGPRIPPGADQIDVIIEIATWFYLHDWSQIQIARALGLDPSTVSRYLKRAREESIVRVEIRRLLLARSMQPLPGNRPLVEALQKHGEAVFGEPIPTSGTPLYTDVRLYCERGIPAAIYGAGPRTVLESNAKRADEHLVLEDLRRATKVVARTLFDLLQ